MEREEEWSGLGKLKFLGLAGGRAGEAQDNKHFVCFLCGFLRAKTRKREDD